MSDAAKAKNCLLGKPFTVSYAVIQEDNNILTNFLDQEYPEYIPSINKYVYLNGTVYVVVSKYFKAEENILCLFIQTQETFEKKQRRH